MSGRKTEAHVCGWTGRCSLGARSRTASTSVCRQALDEARGGSIEGNLVSVSGKSRQPHCQEKLAEKVAVGFGEAETRVGTIGQAMGMGGISMKVSWRK